MLRGMSIAPIPFQTDRLLKPSQTTSRQIQRQLRAEIVTCLLRPGDVMQEREIAAAFGVSRTPVREAFLRLADEGLIEMRPQAGTYVALLDAVAIREALFIRAAVETAAVRRAIARMTAAESRALADTVARHAAAAKCGDAQAGAELDGAFHRAILDASGFGGAWRVVREARDHHARLHHLSRSMPGVSRRVVAQHQTIMKAILAGDADAAATCLGEHIEANVQDLDSISERYPEYFIAASRSR